MESSAERFGAADLAGIDSLVTDLQTHASRFSQMYPYTVLAVTDVYVGGSVGARHGRPGESDLDLGIGLHIESPDSETAIRLFSAYLHTNQAALTVMDDPRITDVDANPASSSKAAQQATIDTSQERGYDTYYDAVAGEYISTDS